MRKALRIAGITILVLLVIINLLIVFSGKTYIYKTLIYTYVGIDDLDLFHHRTVAVAEPQPWPVSANYNRYELPDSLRVYMDKMETVAFVIIHEDSLFYEKYSEGYGDSSLTNSFSMAKSIVSVLTGFALQEGKIQSIEQKVSDFIPEYKEGRRSALTVRHLLQMSAGLRWDEAYESLFSVTTEAYYGTDLHGLLMKEELVTDPGTEFNYQSGATQLLAFVLQKATRKNISEYASEKLWKPLGAEHAAEWSLDHKDGVEKAYCCFYSNARDFARIGSLFMHQGNWKGKQLLDSGWVRQSTTPTGLKDFATGKPDSSYGLLWWIGPDYYYCRGILGQYIVVLPESNTVFVRLGHKREKLVDGTLADVPRYVKYVREMIGEYRQGSPFAGESGRLNLQ